MASVDRSYDARILAVIMFIVLAGWGVRLLLVNFAAPDLPSGCVTEPRFWNPSGISCLPIGELDLLPAR